MLKYFRKALKYFRKALKCFRTLLIGIVLLTLKFKPQLNLKLKPMLEYFRKLLKYLLKYS